MSGDGCARCEESARRQAEAMAPRGVREGYALIGVRDNALVPYGGKPLPDVRMGDLVKVTLVAASVPDMGWCDDCERELAHTEGVPSGAVLREDT